MKQAIIHNPCWKFDSNCIVEGLLEIASDCHWAHLAVSGDLDPLMGMLVHLLNLGGQENIKNRYEGKRFVHQKP